MKKLVFLSIVTVMAVSLFAQEAVPAPSPEAAPAAQAEAVVPTEAAPQAAAPAESAPITPAQPATPSAAATQESYSFESDHYIVRSYVSADHAQAAAARLEAYQVEFNRYFHFDTEKQGLKMKVRIFASKARFDQYLQRIINETRSDYVYLHYSDAARSELVGFVDDAKPAPEASVAHQAFIQFLRSYVANPPLWLREGFAVYFENLAWDDAAGTATMQENLAWLETYKELAYGARTSEALPLDNLLDMSVERAKENIQVFYPQAWGLVHYLANSPVKAHNRILWDSITALEPAASLDENSTVVASKAFKWNDKDAFQSAAVDYYTAKKTYRELIQAGIDQYANGNAKEAEASFSAAVAMQDTSYVPYYYLGLINYDNANYVQAESYYQKALDKGASPALTNYALGVNAFADNRFEAAAVYLQETVKVDATFKDKVDELINRMQG